jgi:hypothetical protein
MADTNFDPATFNYGTNADILKRRRQMAEALMAQGQKMPQGQVVPGGPNGFYVRPSALSGLAAVLQQGLGGYLNHKVDEDQKALDANSQAALAYQFQHLRDTAPATAPDPNGPVAGSNQLPVPDSTQRAPDTPVPTQQLAASLLGPATGSQVSNGIPVDLNNGPTPVPSPSDAAPEPVQSISPAARSVASALVGNGDAPAPSVTPSPAPQPLPVNAGPAMPNILAQPAPQATPSVGQTPGEFIQHMQALANTGPMGQQLATSMLATQFGDKNGRYKVEMNRDPQTGQLAVVRVDTATGNAQIISDGGSGGQKVLETKDTPNGVMERTALGWRPAVDNTGRQVVSTATAADQRAGNDQTMKVSGAVQSNKAAIGAIDAANARLDRINDLYKQTMTGPVAGHLPDWTSARQELHALLAQDLFAETKDAISAAGDAGGAPKMAQSEFKYMANNGGLAQTTNADAAANLIAQQRLRLNSLRNSLVQHGATLNQQNGQTVAPGSGVVIPGKGQTFNGPSADFAARFANNGNGGSTGGW